MPRAKAPNIVAVETMPELVLRIDWRDHGQSQVSLKELIAAGSSLSSLANPAIFAAVRVGEYGWTVTWPDENELDADHLFRLARQQAGESLTPDDFRAWRNKHKLSQSRAAQALGISDRMVKYYEDGRHLIPKTVTLACKGYDAIKSCLAA